MRMPNMTLSRSNSFASDLANANKKDISLGMTLHDLPKSNVFTQSLPSDSRFRNPTESFKASREDLGPRMVKGALFTYIRPENTESPELLSVSHNAMRDIGLSQGEETTQDFKDLVAGNKILWDEKTESGIYPWAQCYGGILSSDGSYKRGN